MKICTRLAALAVVVLMLSGLGLAQQFSDRIAVDIPNDFYVAGMHMSAGNYIFVMNYGDHAVTITNLTSGRRTVVLASPVVMASPGYDMRNEQPSAKLSLRGGKYVLTELETRTEGVSFPVVHASSSMAKNEGTVTTVASLR